jgi:Ketopantoate hydroxymethyltransferase
MSTVQREDPSRSRGPVTIPELLAKKQRGDRLVMVTAYDFPTAEVVRPPGVDLVLAGDTAVTTVLGYTSTVPVTMEEMLTLIRSVRRALRTPLLVGELPFGSYERSHDRAIVSAQRMIKEGGGRSRQVRGPGSGTGPSNRRRDLLGIFDRLQPRFVKPERERTSGWCRRGRANRSRPLVRASVQRNTVGRLR